MSIQGNYNFNGIVVPAIGVVANIRFLSPVSMGFQVPVYANQAQVDAEQPFDAPNYQCAYDANGGDVYAQCYTYLLTLPEYAGWSEIP